MRLWDPDGTVVAESSTGRLLFPVTLPLLNKSRGSQGQPRLWWLQVVPEPSEEVALDVSATVVQTTMVRTRAVTDRIVAILGKDGSNIELYGETTDDRLLLRLKILDEVSAAIVDLRGLLDGVIESVQQDPGVTKDIRANTAINVVNEPRSDEHGFRASFDGVRLRSIGITIGQSEHLQPAVPVLKVDVRSQAP